MLTLARPADRRSQPAQRVRANGRFPLVALWTAVGSSFIDAVTGAVATRSGTAANGALDSGEIGARGNGSTWWTIPTLTLAPPYTVVVRGLAPASTASMLCGNTASTTEFLWLNTGSGNTQVRIAAANSSAFANSASGRLSTYVITVDKANVCRVFVDGVLKSNDYIGASGVWTLNAIGNGYTGSSFALGTGGGVSLLAAMTGQLSDDVVKALSALPNQLFEPSESNDTMVSAIAAAVLAGQGGGAAGGAGNLTTAPGTGGTGGGTAGGAGSLSASAGLAGSGGGQAGGGGTTGPSGTIAIVTPVQYKVHQRGDVSDTADIAISGTYTGTPTSIEARFNGGAWSTISAAPSGGTFAGTLAACAVGQGAIEVRFGNDPSTQASRSMIGVGDIFVCAGQSNHSGRAATAVAPANAVFTACQYGNDGLWKPLQEATSGAGAFDDQTGAVYATRAGQQGGVAGSYFGKLSSLIEQHGVPVAFVPVALGSTNISQHLPGADHRLSSTLYGQALLRAEAAGGHRAMLWWQGESDAQIATSQAAYEASLVTLVDAWAADTGRKTVVYRLCYTGAGSIPNTTTIRNAQTAVPGYNANALLGPDMGSAWAGSNIHYSSSGDINSVAALAFASLGTLFGYTDAAALVGTGGAAAGGAGGLSVQPAVNLAGGGGALPGGAGTLAGGGATLSGSGGAQPGGAGAMNTARLKASPRYLARFQRARNFMAEK